MYNHIYVIHQNIDGLISKADTLVVNIDNLNDLGKRVGILCLTEHNMLQQDVTSLSVEGFKLASYYCRDVRRGGSCILVRRDYQYEILNVVEKMSVPGIIECSGIKLTEHKINIVCIYRPPRQLAHEYDHFFSRLNDILSYLSYKISNYKLIICGDFNIHILKTTKYSSRFRNTLKDYSLKLEFNEVTRPHSNTGLDNVAHNIRGCKGETVELALSDHMAQLVKIQVKKTCKLKYWYKIKQDLCPENRTKFINYIKELTFEESFLEANADDAFKKFHDMFKLMYDLCFPMKRVKMLTFRKPKWVSKGLKLCSKKNRHLLWRYRAKPNEETKKMFKTYNARYKAIVKLTQKAQNEYYIKQSLSKSKAVWNIINKTNSNLPREEIHKICANGRQVDQPKKNCGCF